MQDRFLQCAFANIVVQRRACLAQEQRQCIPPLEQVTDRPSLERTLDQFFGLSLRLWYLVLPHLDFLPAAVEKHLDMVEAIKTGDADRAEAIMRDHVQSFYNKVQQILAAEGE